MKAIETYEIYERRFGSDKILGRVLATSKVEAIQTYSRRSHTTGIPSRSVVRARKEKKAS